MLYTITPWSLGEPEVPLGMLSHEVPPLMSQARDMVTHQELPNRGSHKIPVPQGLRVTWGGTTRSPTAPVTPGDTTDSWRVPKRILSRRDDAGWGHPIVTPAPRR